MNTRRSLGSITTVLAALTLVTATAYAADVTGTAGDDHLTGTASADTLRGLAGDDHLDGRRGPDRLFGGTGSDFMLGGDGGADGWLRQHRRAGPQTQPRRPAARYHLCRSLRQHLERATGARELYALPAVLPLSLVVDVTVTLSAGSVVLG